ncbi:MAG TPA: zf-HC2 domain-containing protein [Steroidobacteraceae bacterium]|jgi:anti-sigma factor RsiW
MTLLTPQQDHDLSWNDRLQDWLDGDLPCAEVAEFEAHLAGCVDCQQMLGELQRLDASLQAAAPEIQLDQGFDERLFAQIDTIDETQRARARTQAEQEFQNNLRSLAHGWHRTLGFVLPGIVGGIALAFAITAWFDGSGLTGTVVAESAGELGRFGASYTHVILTTIIGAGIGAGLARWLSSVAE